MNPDCIPLSRRIVCTAMKHLRRYITGSASKDSILSLMWVQDEKYGICEARKAKVFMDLDDFKLYVTAINSIVEEPTKTHKEAALKATGALLPYIPQFVDEPEADATAVPRIANVLSG